MALARLNIYPDVNGDEVVDVRDLVGVASEMTSSGSPVLGKSSVETDPLTAENLTEWIQLAKALDIQDARMQRGIIVLEQLLAMLTQTVLLPKETALLSNYPNPFNPETWIPYQLSKPAEVHITIHSLEGKLIRSLALGLFPVGVYHSKSRAVYWDGRNGLGELVASGVYFYTLTAGEFTATRKMIVRK